MPWNSDYYGCGIIGGGCHRVPLVFMLLTALVIRFYGIVRVQVTVSWIGLVLLAARFSMEPLMKLDAHVYLPSRCGNPRLDALTTW